MNLRDMMDLYQEEGLTRELSAARVCQDIVLKAISAGPLNHNVTVKGGIVMRSIKAFPKQIFRNSYIMHWWNLKSRTTGKAG